MLASVITSHAEGILGHVSPAGKGLPKAGPAGGAGFSSSAEGRVKARAEVILRGDEDEEADKEGSCAGGGKTWGIGRVGGFGTSPGQFIVVNSSSVSVDSRSAVVASWNDLVMSRKDLFVSGKVLGDSMRALIVVGDMSQM
jgi:hypothetical protein